MPNNTIEKINIGGTPYDIQDVTSGYSQIEIDNLLQQGVIIGMVILNGNNYIIYAPNESSDAGGLDVSFAGTNLSLINATPQEFQPIPIIIADTQSFSIPNYDYDGNEDYRTIFLTLNPDFKTTYCSSNQNMLERFFYDEHVHHIDFIIDNNTITIYPDEFWGRDSLFQADMTFWDLPIMQWSLTYYDNGSVSNDEWDNNYKGTTHTIQIIAYMNNVYNG